jgi:hypothetical protein
MNNVSVGLIEMVLGFYDSWRMLHALTKLLDSGCHLRRLEDFWHCPNIVEKVGHR